MHPKFYKGADHLCFIVKKNWASKEQSRLVNRIKVEFLLCYNKSNFQSNSSLSLHWVKSFQLLDYQMLRARRQIHSPLATSELLLSSLVKLTLAKPQHGSSTTYLLLNLAQRDKFSIQTKFP